MYDLTHFKYFVDEINKENSRLYKQSILKKFKDDEIVKAFLKFAFDPFIVFGLSEKKLYKDVEPKAYVNTTLGLLHYLKDHNTGRDADIQVAQSVLRCLPTDLHALLTTVICKDLSIGCDAKTINKEMPGLIKTFTVQLAQKYFDNPTKLEGKEFVVTEKLDGIRIIAIRDSAGTVNFYSRVGQPITGLVELEEEMKKLPLNVVLDGEITISNYRDMPSGDAYKATTKIVRSKDTEKRGLTMRVFDGMLANEFTSQLCSSPYDLRRSFITELCASLSHFEVLPILYRGTDTSKILELLNEAVAKKQEGVMINIVDAKYEFKRTWNLMKVKKFDSLDLEVVGVEEGEGRLSGTLGAIKVRYKNGNIVKVGSGFSDEERKLYWQQPELILNKVVEIKFFEETTNADKTFSLRFPTWCSNIRIDKLEPDF